MCGVCVWAVWWCVSCGGVWRRGCQGKVALHWLCMSKALGLIKTLDTQAGADAKPIFGRVGGKGGWVGRECVCVWCVCVCGVVVCVVWWCVASPHNFRSGLWVINR